MKILMKLAWLAVAAVATISFAASSGTLQKVSAILPNLMGQEEVKPRLVADQLNAAEADRLDVCRDLKGTLKRAERLGAQKEDLDDRVAELKQEAQHEFAVLDRAAEKFATLRSDISDELVAESKAEQWMPVGVVQIRNRCRADWRRVEMNAADGRLRLVGDGRGVQGKHVLWDSDTCRRKWLAIR